MKKQKRVAWGRGVLAKFVSWKNIGAWLAQNAQHFRQASMHSTFAKLRCTYATHNALQHYHSCVRSASGCPARNLCLASAACKTCTCNDDHMLCSSFCLANYGFSPAPQKRHIYVYRSHLRKISVLYIKHTCSFWGRWGGGRGSKEMARFRFFRKYR